MKKVIAIILITVLAFTLIACDDDFDDRVYEKNTNAAENSSPAKTENYDSPPESTVGESDIIDRDYAIDIALKSAGLTRDSVYDLDAELEHERNGTYWEVDFETREYDYSYIIDAVTGEIVHSEQEWDD